MLKEKTAIITGASRGIGAAIALEFARLGANVALVYAHDEAGAQEVCRQAQQSGVTARCYCCDVSDFEACKQLAVQVRADFGGVDILVNNAGLTRDGLVIAMKEADFDTVLDTNLKGAFHMIRHVAPLMIRARRGRIINISSVAGLMGNAGQVNYAASKAGLVGLTKSVARELASRGITCNAIAPGFICTDMTKQFQDDIAVLKAIPLGRMGSCADVASAAAFLASDAASYITGEVLRVDGGMAM